MPKLQPNQNHSQTLIYPPKSVAFTGTAVEFTPEYADNGARSNGLLWYTNKYQGAASIDRYPSVYDNYGGGLFTKNYNVIVNDYFENLRFIDASQMALYNYLLNKSSRGYRVSVHGKKPKLDARGVETDPGTAGLAAIFGWSPRTTIDNLDRLEDVLLMHRITRLDWQGAPSEYVMHTPFDADRTGKFPADRSSLITGRLQKAVTKQRRLGAAKHPAGKGRTHDMAAYLAKPTDFPFQYDHRATVDAFGDRTADFIEFALVFFKLNWRKLGTDRRGDFQKNYRDGMTREMELWSIDADKRFDPHKWRLRGKDHKELCFRAANKFRHIYCPTLEELCV